MLRDNRSRLVRAAIIVCAQAILGSQLHSDAANLQASQRPSMSPIPAGEAVSRMDYGTSDALVACTLQWQGSVSFIEENSIAGGYRLAAHQDPAADGCPGPFPFGVTHVIWNVYFQFDEPVTVQLLLVHDTGTVSCPRPGGILHTGPTYIVNPPAAGPWVIRMSLTDTVCVNEPYFAGLRIVSPIDTGLVDILVDTNPPQLCRTFRDTGVGWNDLVGDDGFLHNMQIWSSGLDPSQNGCPNNQCPINVSVIPNPVDAVVGELATATVSATDPDAGGVLKYFLVSGPGSVDSMTGEWSYITTCSDFPGFTVTVEASDRGDGGCPQSQASFQVNVSAPEMLIDGCVPVTTHWGSLASLQLSAIGGCGPVAFTMISGPGSVTPTGAWSYQTDCGDIGSYSVSIRATDATGQMDTCQIDLDVTNIAPGCSAPGPVSAPEGVLTQIPLGPANQADGDALQYSLVSGPEWGGINGANWVGTRPMGDLADYNVCFTVTDMCATSAPCCFLVTEACECECHADPECDGVTNIVDVVLTVNRAFRGSPMITFCPAHPEVDGRTDVDCTGSTDIVDVVKVIEVAFRGVDPATKFCEACAP